MKYEGRKDIKDLMIDTGKYLPDLPSDKLMVMKFETSSIMRKYERELAINYISTNFAPNKHLTITGLHGMSDDVVIGYLEKIAKDVDAEIERRGL